MAVMMMGRTNSGCEECT